MTLYRIYITARDGHFAGPTEKVECADDHEAVFHLHCRGWPEVFSLCAPLGTKSAILVSHIDMADAIQDAQQDGIIR